MTLVQTGKSPPMKIVLMGREYWDPLAEWMRTILLARYATISPEDLNLFTITDEVEVAVNEICTFYERDRSVAGQPSTAQELMRHPRERVTAEGTVYGVPSSWKAPPRGG